MNKLKDSKEIYLELQKIYKKTDKDDIIRRNLLRTFGKMLMGENIQYWIPQLEDWIEDLMGIARSIDCCKELYENDDALNINEQIKEWLKEFGNY